MADKPQTTGTGRRRAIAGDQYVSDLAPTDDEIEEWANRERARRGAWLGGPGEEEKRAWAESVRQRSSDLEPGLAAAGPTQDEIDDWAERESSRRQAWLAGPTEEDKRAWARSRSSRSSWTRYESHEGSYARSGRTPYPGSGRSSWRDDERCGCGDDTMWSMWRESELASKGAWRWLVEAPDRYWMNFVDIGREWEETCASSDRPRRIRLYASY